jgi:hypothetical protein
MKARTQLQECLLETSQQKSRMHRIRRLDQQPCSQLPELLSLFPMLQKAGPDKADAKVGKMNKDCANLFQETVKKELHSNSEAMLSMQWQMLKNSIVSKVWWKFFSVDHATFRCPKRSTFPQRTSCCDDSICCAKVSDFTLISSAASGHSTTQCCWLWFCHRHLKETLTFLFDMEWVFAV